MTAAVQILKITRKSLGSVSLERCFTKWKQAYFCSLQFFFNTYIFLLSLNLRHRLFRHSRYLLNIGKLN